MRLLERKIDIDKFKIADRKREQDEGLALATKVDALRRVKAEEEKNLSEYRTNAIKSIQYDIDQFLEEKANLERQNNEARQIRDALLKPDIVQVKAELENLVNSEVEKRSNYLSTAKLKVETQKLKDEQKRISLILSQVTLKENETEKAKQQAISLAQMAREKYEVARDEHIHQTESYEKALSDARRLQETYENGIAVLEKERQEVKEKEVDIIIREKRLASQQVATRLAMEEIKKYGTNSNPEFLS